MIKRLSKKVLEYLGKQITNQLSNVTPPTYLGNNLMLCKMRWGGWVVVPTFNIDVAIGAIRDGLIEAATTDFVMSNLNFKDTYINVGANFGYYTCLAGNIVGAPGRIWSFEANPVMFAVLLKTAYYAGIIDRVSLFNRAVSNSTGENIEFHFDYQFIGGGSILPKDCTPVTEEDLFWHSGNMEFLLNPDGSYCVGRGLYKKIMTKTITLDSAIPTDTVNMMQCDAEGAEPFILLGAKELISRSKQVKIIFEWTSDNYQKGDDLFKNSVHKLWEFFDREGFIVKRILPQLQKGKATLSGPIKYETMITSAQHGDYFAYRY